MAEITQQFQLALKYLQSGHLAQAQGLFESILEQYPTHAPSLYYQGMLGIQQQDLDTAEKCFIRAHEIDPLEAEYLNALGNLQRLRQQPESAYYYYQKALDIDPHISSVLNNLGDLHAEKTEWEQALEYYHRSLESNPLQAYPCLEIGAVLQHKGQLQEATEWYERALELEPNSWQAHFNLGNIAQEHRQFEHTIHFYKKALELAPQQGEVYNNLGLLLEKRGNIQDAISHYQQAIQFNPQLTASYANLANALRTQGEPEKAIPFYQQALQRTERESEKAHICSKQLVCYYSMPDISEVKLAHHFIDWGKRFAPLLKVSRYYSNTREPDRKLRIGYVSEEFCDHSPSRALLPLFKNHSLDDVETFAYADLTLSDHVTEQFQARVDHWIPVTGIGHGDLARRIEKDEIDILVDLSGHTGRYGRLLTFARKPAPIQITGPVFPFTTGLPQMDYFFSDAIVTPPTLAKHFTEKTLYLTSWLHWLPPEFQLPVGNPPSQSNGYITFGTANHPLKLNRKVIAIWAQILKQIPHSRLYLKAIAFNDEYMHQCFIQAFAEHGISQKRLLFGGQKDTYPEHLSFYQDIDMALDPFPYNGCITSCDALWMGVPIVTNRHSMRVCASILTLLGMEEWVAHTEADYIQIAVKMAEKQLESPLDRSTVRQWLLQSPICNGQQFAKEVEAHYRAIWQKWCQKQG